MKTTGGAEASERKPLPMPVLNYDEDRYGLRAIDHLAEWRQKSDQEFANMG